MPCVKSHDDLPFHIHPETGKRELDAYAWPGGYPVFYVEKGFSGESVVCRKCANHTVNETETAAENTSHRIVGWDINYEDPDLYCSACGDRIESAYAEWEDN